ncbi:hypothetical protein P7K49_034580 [Saguinus oedipus]|uniref:Uncharacterized protein n=1 Tax=Saguinus oedipus TaxID=9490 RepID=A0ABQ9TW98_SAGOE|nr:hypothetical protein P7K49_034580 [Saguinus oedipus]
MALGPEFPPSPKLSSLRICLSVEATPSTWSTMPVLDPEAHRPCQSLRKNDSPTGLRRGGTHGTGESAIAKDRTRQLTLRTYEIRFLA